MKQEIKERVERIRKGEVPEGYRKTKVGIIPVEWGVKKLSKITDVRDGTHESPKYVNEGIPFITSKNLLGNKIDWQTINYITKEDHLNYSKRSKVDDGDILFGMIGTIGNPTLVKNKFDFSIKNVALIKFGNSDINNKYLLNVLKSNIINKQFHQQSNSAVQQFIALGTIRNLIIPICDTNEQNKITNILSTWDKAIELKEKLIEEKNEFKRGLMNNMISAKMNDDSSWKFTKFKDIFKMIKRPIDKHPEEEYKRLTVKRRLGGVQLRDIKKGKEILVDSQHIVKEGDFIISNRQVFHGAIGVVQKKLENSIISMEYSILRCNEGFDTEFLFYCMYSPQFKKTIIKRTQGIHEEKFVFLFNEWYKTLGLHIPSIDEQRSTVSVLNNLNENIQILTNEVAQLKEQKKGLMQLLLTGIVRVEVN